MSQLHRLLFAALSASVALVLVLCSPSSYAQDALTDIEKHQERIEGLENEFAASQRRILAYPNTVPAQDWALDKLSFVGNLLSFANREFGALSRSLRLAALVTDKQAIPYARAIIKNQEDSMAKRFQSATEFAEKAMLRAEDIETKRLLLEARDIFNASTTLVVRLRTSDATIGTAK